MEQSGEHNSSQYSRYFGSSDGSGSSGSPVCRQSPPSDEIICIELEPPSTVQCNFPPNCGFVGSVKDTAEHFFTHVPRNRFQCKKCSIQFFTMASFLKHGDRYHCHATAEEYKEVSPSRNDLADFRTNWNSYVKTVENVPLPMPQHVSAPTPTVISPVLTPPSAYQPMSGQYSRYFGSRNGFELLGQPVTHGSQPAPASVPSQPGPSSEVSDDIICIQIESESPVYGERDYSKLDPSWRQYPEPTEP